MIISNRLIRLIKTKETLSRVSLSNLIKKYYGNISRSYFYQITSNLVDTGVLTRVDSHTYSTQQKASFSYSLTDENIENAIKGYGDYVIWDTNVFNKWMNHLLNNVVTFVEVNKEFMSLVVGELRHAGYYNILINPSVREFYKYYDEHTIVIKPIANSLAEKEHRISIERLIIELYSNKIAKTMCSENELANMINEIFKTYNVDLNKLYHIARRKKIYGKFHSFLVKNVDRKFIYHD